MQDRKQDEILVSPDINNETIKPKQNGQVSYVVDKFIAKGSFGSVYKTKLKFLNGEKSLKEKIEKNEWVIKTISKDRFLENEPIILAHYQPTFNPMDINKNTKGWVTRFLPGTTIYNLPISLDGYAALDLVNKIVLTLNLHHHNTPSTGSAIVHADLNLKNIVIHHEEINFTDYGLSIAIDDDPNFLQKRHISGLNFMYFPPEVLNGNWGIKTDIYMIADAIKYILDLDSLPNTDPDVKVYVKHFIRRMREENYHRRPDSDETLKFFHALNLFYKLNKLPNPDIALKNEYAAKLALRVHGQWHKKINDTQTWQNFDFVKSPIATDIILKLTARDSKRSKKTKINFAPFVDETLQRALTILDRQGLLTKEVIFELQENKKLCSDIVASESDSFLLTSIILSSLTPKINQPQLEKVLNYVTAINMELDLTCLTMLKVQ